MTLAVETAAGKPGSELPPSAVLMSRVSVYSWLDTDSDSAAFVCGAFAGRGTLWQRRGPEPNDGRDLVEAPPVPYFVHVSRRTVDRHRPVHGLHHRPGVAPRPSRCPPRHDRGLIRARYPDADALRHHLHLWLVLAVRMGFLTSLSRVLVGHRRARYRHRAHGAGLGYLLPTNLLLYFEVRKPQPDTQKIARWMRTYLRVVAVQGTMQVAIIVVMARFVTVRGH